MVDKPGTTSHTLKKKKPTKISTQCVAFCAKVLIAEFPSQFSIFNTSNNFLLMAVVSTKWGRSCEWTVSKFRLLKTGHFGSDFLEGAPRMYKHQESGIFLVKVWYLLKGHTYSVVFSGELGKM